MTSNKMKELINKAKLCKEKILNYKSILLVSHIDADGITSASILFVSLKRCNINCSVEFIKKLDDHFFETEIFNRFNTVDKLIIFTDLGSSYIDFFINSNINCIVLDHHEPMCSDINLKRFKYHLNPHLIEINGSYEISGSGLSYILASQLGNNEDLISLAIVGAIGDMQNRKYGKLVSLNKEILDIGINKGIISKFLDLSLFGKQTRKIHKIFQYSQDPYIPNITGNEMECINLIKNVCMNYNKNDNIYWFNLNLS